MSKIALGVEYQGTDYCGWQSQKHCVSIQKLVEEALTNIADEKISVRCAGRTDSGVHAIGQVIDFETNAIRPARAWIEGANTKLPLDIRISWHSEVADDFSARFSAIARQYRYVIFNRKVHSAILAKKATWVRKKLDIFAMNQAAQVLLGEQDFTSFRASSCQANNAKRNLQKVSVTSNGNFVFIDVQANAFLHHMVRNITGSLIRIGLGERDKAWLTDLLALKDRSKAAMTAPADGLYFVNALYPEKYNIPKNELTELLWNA